MLTSFGSTASRPASRATIAAAQTLAWALAAKADAEQTAARLADEMQQLRELVNRYKTEASAHKTEANTHKNRANRLAAQGASSNEEAR